MPKPIIHGRDHAPGGADPIPFTPADGIRFDTAPQAGGYLLTTTEGPLGIRLNATGEGTGSSGDITIWTSETSDPTAPPGGDAGSIEIFADGGGVDMFTVGGGALNVFTDTDGEGSGSGDLNLGTKGHSDIVADAGGSIYLRAGHHGTGNIVLLFLPTSDPGVTGALWNNGGTLSIS
jgi:hypothetical protein